MEGRQFRVVIGYQFLRNPHNLLLISPFSSVYVNPIEVVKQNILRGYESIELLLPKLLRHKGERRGDGQDVNAGYFDQWCPCKNFVRRN